MSSLYSYMKKQDLERVLSMRPQRFSSEQIPLVFYNDAAFVIRNRYENKEYGQYRVLTLLASALNREEIEGRLYGKDIVVVSKYTDDDLLPNDRWNFFNEKNSSDTNIKKFITDSDRLVRLHGVKRVYCHQDHYPYSIKCYPQMTRAEVCKEFLSDKRESAKEYITLLKESLLTPDV